jgi:hypothetical protein
MLRFHTARGRRLRRNCFGFGNQTRPDHVSFRGKGAIGRPVGLCQIPLGKPTGRQLSHLAACLAKRRIITGTVNFPAPTRRGMCAAQVGPVSRSTGRLTAQLPRRPAPECANPSRSNVPGPGPPPRSRIGNGRASQVPGGPSCAYACSPTGRTGHTRPIRCTVPVNFRTKAPTTMCLARLNQTVLALAVCASQDARPRTPEKSASAL